LRARAYGGVAAGALRAAFDLRRYGASVRDRIELRTATVLLLTIGFGQSRAAKTCRNRQQPAQSDQITMDNRPSKPPDASQPIDRRTESHPGSDEEVSLHLLRQLAQRKDQDMARRGISPAILERHPARPDRIEAAHADATRRTRGARGLTSGLTSGMTWGLVAASLCLAGLLAGLLGFFWYWHDIRSPVRTTAPRERIAPPPVAPAVRAAATAAQSVQQAMAACDRDAQADPTALHLLLIPIKPESDAARAEIPAGEVYGTFFLLTSQAALDGLRSGDYAMNGMAFGFAIMDSATLQTRTWNFVAGLTRLTHKDPNGFANFQIGFDQTSRGYGLQWTGQFPRRPGVCYWVNVRFRLQSY
jgi:hypothetical protein